MLASPQSCLRRWPYRPIRRRPSLLPNLPLRARCPAPHPLGRCPKRERQRRRCRTCPELRRRRPPKPERRRPRSRPKPPHPHRCSPTRRQHHQKSRRCRRHRGSHRGTRCLNKRRTNRATPWRTARKRRSVRHPSDGSLASDRADATVRPASALRARPRIKRSRDHREIVGRIHDDGARARVGVTNRRIVLAILEILRILRE